MLEYWNDGMAPFGQINACGGDSGDRWFCRHPVSTVKKVNVEKLKVFLIFRRKLVDFLKNST
jgi:hypothetical protein